jgi:hypothetical protein
VPTYQRQDYRHGGRSVAGTINGELSPGTWKDFIAAAVRRDFTAISAVSRRVDHDLGHRPDVHRRARGRILADRRDQGRPGRPADRGSLQRGEPQQEPLHFAVTALNLTVLPSTASALVAEGPIGSATFSFPGKVTFVPQTGHTDKSFSFEHWHGDLVQSELLRAARSTSSTSRSSRKAWRRSTGRSSARTSRYRDLGVLHHADGADHDRAARRAEWDLLVQGVRSPELHLAQFLDQGQHAGRAGDRLADLRRYHRGPRAGRRPGLALFDGVTLRDYFVNETEVGISVCLASSNAAAADFMTSPSRASSSATRRRTTATRRSRRACPSPRSRT